MVSFNKNRCKGCELCVTACPKSIIQLARDEMNEKGFHPAVCVNQSACISCAFCAIVCPDAVITVEKKTAAIP